MALEHTLAHGADAALLVLARFHGAATLAGHGLPNRRDLMLGYALETKPHRGGRSASRKIGGSRRRGLVERRRRRLGGKGTEAEPPDDPMASFISGRGTKLGRDGPAAAGAAPVGRGRRERGLAELADLGILVYEGRVHLRRKGRERRFDGGRGVVEEVQQRGRGDRGRIGGLVDAWVGEGPRANVGSDG